MNCEIIISIVSTSISLLILFTTIYFSSKAKKSSNEARISEKKANYIVIGQSETMLREAIARARERVEENCLQIADFLNGRNKEDIPDSQKSYYKILEKKWESAIENLINSYEDACGKYIDNKIDKERFKKIYFSEIKNICDPKVKSYADFMHPKATTNFEAVWKVYDEWYKHEK